MVETYSLLACFFTGRSAVTAGPAIFRYTNRPALFLSFAMRIIGLCLCFCYAAFASAAVDLEKTMKDMGFQFKQAIETQHSQQLLPYLEHLIALTEQAQQANFADDKAEQFRHGLAQVLTELEFAKVAAQRDDVATAQQHLRQVEALRKQYHKQRKVSIWQLLFG